MAGDSGTLAAVLLTRRGVVGMLAVLCVMILGAIYSFGATADYGMRETAAGANEWHSAEPTRRADRIPVDDDYAYLGYSYYDDDYWLYSESGSASGPEEDFYYYDDDYYYQAYDDDAYGGGSGLEEDDDGAWYGSDSYAPAAGDTGDDDAYYWGQGQPADDDDWVLRQ